MNRTEHHGLPQWEEQDRILRTDFNEANAAVDAALHALDADTAALQADTWKKEQTLAAATRLLYSLAAGAAPDAAFVKLAAVLPWRARRWDLAVTCVCWWALPMTAPLPVIPYCSTLRRQDLAPRLPRGFRKTARETSSARRP